MILNKLVQSYLKWFVSLLLFIPAMISYADVPSQIGDFAIYYGSKLPAVFRLYKQVVVQPEYIKHFDPNEFNTPYREAVAYVSLGEVTQFKFNNKEIDKKWIIGQNTVWKSDIIDQSNPQWQQFFLNNIITPLWETGYRGFYLDTLDSYRLVAHDPVKIKQQQQGLIATVKAIKQKYPTAHLVFNRGIELLPEVRTMVSRVTIESVFSGWDESKKSYYDVDRESRKWVLQDIEKIKKLNIPVTIIDYVSPSSSQKIDTVTNQIEQVNCHPWVTDETLTHAYLPADVTAAPRKILMFYRGKLHNTDERIGSPAVRSLSMPLNYLGYSIELRNINRPIPMDISPQEYAGIVMSINGILLGREDELYRFYLQQLKNHMPLVVLNDFGFMLTNKKLKPFGLSLALITHRSHTLTRRYQSSIIGYEIQPSIEANNFLPLQLNPIVGRSLLKVVDEVGLLSDVVGITSWGGYYQGDSFLQRVISQDYRWAINPFEFFKQALKLPDIPIADTTSENGMRLMFTQIDGDGFANKGEWYGADYVSEIMRSEILEHYALPTTVSIIQGEIAANGIHPTMSKDLEAIARKIFAMPSVEIASHTYSHPYNWHEAEIYKEKKPNPHILPIPHYRFNLDTEIVGSVNYINTTLAPKGKKCKVFLWSGEGDASEYALKLVDELGLRNMNPGTIVTKYNHSMTRISSLGMSEGPYFQVFAPIGNDQELQGQDAERFFYSIINLINALQITEHPVRLKPIDIYLHFYTMAQPGGVKALQSVYEWVLTQPIMAIYGSEYIDKVFDFNELSLIKRGKQWLIATHDHLREFRIPTSMGIPDLSQSDNIVGFNLYQDHYYIHVGPGGDAVLSLSTKENPPPNNTPYLVQANARIVSASRQKNHLHYTFKGYQPIKFEMNNIENCTFLWNKSEISPQEGTSLFVLKETTGEVDITCH